MTWYKLPNQVRIDSESEHDFSGSEVGEVYDDQFSDGEDDTKGKEKVKFIDDSEVDSDDENDNGNSPTQMMNDAMKESSGRKRSSDSDGIKYDDEGSLTDPKRESSGKKRPRLEDNRPR